MSHHTPHFHAYFQDQVAVYGIDPIEIISGSLPKTATASRGGLGGAASSRAIDRLGPVTGGPEAPTY